ncbi:MAG: metal-dependent hydrolase [candidate division WWE3 bacterium]|nr:metal-dependent hydrolase [candidate division WWE3 bacterium]
MEKAASRLDLIILYFKFGVLDLSMGLLLGLVLSIIFKQSHNYFAYALGSAAAVLPDLDLIIKYLLHNPKIKSHRELIHKPLLIIPVLFLITLLSHGSIYLVVLTTGVCWHFFHDTLGDLNWPGLPLWPLPYRLGIRSHYDGKVTNFKNLQIIKVSEIKYVEKAAKTKIEIICYAKKLELENLIALILIFITITIVVATFH